MTRLEGSAELLDDVTRQFEERTVPVLQGLDGFEGYVLMGDRASGLAMAITYWASAEDLQASEEAVSPERERAAEAAQATSGPVIERYEVVASS